MILFLQKTWFLWWFLANVFVLRWFHLFSSHAYESAFEAADPAEDEASSTSKQIPSVTVSRLSA
jgi:hypothetical protein